MRRHLPSIASLRAFEAAARHLSFTRAARELNLTQTAVSHQVKSLEDLLGVTLFLRERHGIRLTDVARDYLDGIRPALFGISAATERAMDSNKENVLTVACQGTFAIKCLVPHLDQFREQHPDISLRIMTLVSFEQLVRHDYDVAIRYGTGDWPRMAVQQITAEQFFPVCSPRLVDGTPELRSPKDLRFRTIIRTTSNILDDYWPSWLEQAGVADMTFQDEILCDTLSTSIQGAIEGLGVAMARSTVVASDLRNGRLVEPFSLRLPSTAEGYYLVAQTDHAELRKVKAFSSWILASFSS